jgi:hypothetical protein
MKRIFWIALTSVMAVAATMSCQKENNALTGTDTVTFTVMAPAGVQTKDISDGLTVNCVYWAAFDENNAPVEGLSGKEIMTDRRASFDVKLVKDYPYNFVFWAQYEDASGVQKAYDLTSFDSDAKVQVSYTGDANDECRDAFYKQKIIKISSAGESRTIELRRPFAQINFLAADYQSVEEVEVHKSLKSTVTIEGLPTVLNLLDGSVEGSGSTVLSATPVPTDPAYFTVKGVQYGWYSMNYVLASAEKRLNSVTATFTHDKSANPVVLEVANVPYQRNYRTNIIGDFLTEIAQVNVVVMEEFDEPDYIVENN